MATYCTPENCQGSRPRNQILEQVLLRLKATVNWDRHRLIVIDNSPGDLAKQVLNRYNFFQVIDNQGRNLGTADAINLAWRTRGMEEHAVKMDDDCYIHAAGWLDDMEEAVKRLPSIGIIGLKRNDCWENPAHESEFYRSTLRQTPKTPAQPWIVIEQVRHVIGTCQMYNADLLNKIGFLKQPDAYGFDDVWAAIRSELSGFINCFLTGYKIDHLDPGDTVYQKKKEAHAGNHMTTHHRLKEQWEAGSLDVHHVPDWDKLKTLNRTL